MSLLTFDNIHLLHTAPVNVTVLKMVNFEDILSKALWCERELFEDNMISFIENAVFDRKGYLTIRWINNTFIITSVNNARDDFIKIYTQLLNTGTFLNHEFVSSDFQYLSFPCLDLQQYRTLIRSLVTGYSIYSPDKIVIRKKVGNRIRKKKYRISIQESHGGDFPW